MSLTFAHPGLAQAAGNLTLIGFSRRTNSGAFPSSNEAQNSPLLIKLARVDSVSGK